MKSDRYPTVEEAIDASNDGWFNEHHDIPIKYLREYNPPSPAEEEALKKKEWNKHKDVIHLGHFTQIAQDKATEMGCAAAEFHQPGTLEHPTMLATYIVCNYNMGNLLNHAVYEVAHSHPGDRCPDNQHHATYTALCVDTYVQKPEPPPLVVPLDEKEQAKFFKRFHKTHVVESYKKYASDDNDGNEWDTMELCEENKAPKAQCLTYTYGESYAIEERSDYKPADVPEEEATEAYTRDDYKHLLPLTH